MDAYHGLMRAFPEDLHIARPMIQMLQSRGETEAAREFAMTMARRMLSLGYSSYALAFISICEQLEHPNADEIDGIKTMAELTAGSIPHQSEEASQVFELIEALSDFEAQSFLKQGTLLRISKGKNIVNQGEVSRHFYLILEGVMQVYMDTKGGQHIDLIELKKGEFFGEFASVYQLPRTATVTAFEDATVLQFQDSVISELMDLSPVAGDSLMQVIQRRMIGSVSYAHPVFADIEAADRTWLGEESELIEFAADESLIQDGEQDDSFYIIAFGEAVASRKVGDESFSCDLAVNTIYGNASDALALPMGTKLVAKERCLVCKVPLEIFNAFSMAYGGFDLWVENHVTERNQKLHAV
jgi:CRP-like cAMP-binding protein